MCLGDCVEVMATMADASIDAIVTDPPYGLEFMGKKWDRLGASWHETWAREALRVLKPGGHLLAFGGTRTYHRLACGVEDAGFEIRDTIAWMYGSGFPKSRTTLKPAHEPIVVARRSPIGAVAANVLTHGTGALNIDGCRIGTNDDLNGGAYTQTATARYDGKDNWRYERGKAGEYRQPTGRWPANVCLDESAAAHLDEMTGNRPAGGDVKTGRSGFAVGYMGGAHGGSPTESYGDSGGASRFFYCAKASSAERNAGLEGFAAVGGGAYANGAGMPGRTFKDGAWMQTGTWREPNRKPRANSHPTVKPIALMRWLVRLVTPPGGLVLDPFAGSGTTGIAAALEGMKFVGVEREPEYLAIAQARIAHWTPRPDSQLAMELP